MTVGQHEGKVLQGVTVNPLLLLFPSIFLHSLAPCANLSLLSFVKKTQTLEVPFSAKRRPHGRSKLMLSEQVEIWRGRHRSLFKHHFLHDQDRCIPLRNKSRKGGRRPAWMSKEILE